MLRNLLERGLGVSKTALITGVCGQDGIYLSGLLLSKGYTVFGTSRKGGEQGWPAALDPRVNRLRLDLRDTASVESALSETSPDEIYNLAAQSSVAESFKRPVETAEVTGTGALRLLEAIRQRDTRIKFYQASSSEMFGLPKRSPQDESTPFWPRSPYAAAKLFAHAMTINYRESYGIFTCSGILFNHESPLRGLNYVTRKITRAAAAIRLGLQERLMLGNMDARRDWGYAPEYVEAMWKMLQMESPGDYVIATGQLHSVREFAEAAFAALGMPMAWEGEGAETLGRDKSTGKVVVAVNPEFFRPAEVVETVGDASKARKKLGFEPRTSFQEIVRIMVEHDLQELRQSSGAQGG